MSDLGFDLWRAQLASIYCPEATMLRLLGDKHDDLLRCFYHAGYGIDQAVDFVESLDERLKFMLKIAAKKSSRFYADNSSFN